jgi:hypothetical protein
VPLLFGSRVSGQSDRVSVEKAAFERLIVLRTTGTTGDLQNRSMMQDAIESNYNEAR